MSQSNLSGPLNVEGALVVGGAATITGALGVTGAMIPAAVASGDGAITIANSIVYITKGSAAALTLADPTATTHDGIIIWIVATTGYAHTIDNSAGSGFNGGGAGADVCTFTAAAGNNLAVIAYQGVWYVLNNVNGTLA